MSNPQEIIAALTRIRDEANNLKVGLENTETPTDAQIRAALIFTHQEISVLAAALVQLVTPGAMPPPQIPPGQLFDMERRAAINRIWTESHLKGADDRSKLVVEIGIVALRSVFLVNGAAIVALLTFLGNVETVVNPTMLQVAFRDFTIGLVLCLIAMGLSYITQQLFSHSEYDRAGAVYVAVINNEPERPDAGQSPTGLVLQIAAFVLAAGSLLFFCLGAFAALSGLFPPS